MPDREWAHQTVAPGIEKHPRILLSWFSFQGATAALAEAVSERLQGLGTVDEFVIKPRRRHGYWTWLALSFLPGSRVPIEPAGADAQGYDLVVLGFPKWTVSCPPVNQYLRLLEARPGTRFALFMSFGGFDQERYLAQMVRRLVKRRCEVIATVSVKRRLIEEGLHRDVLEPFLNELAQALTAGRDTP
jgi:hypothetical protein